LPNLNFFAIQNGWQSTIFDLEFAKICGIHLGVILHLWVKLHGDMMIISKDIHPNIHFFFDFPHFSNNKMAASQPFWTWESRKLVYSLKASYTTSLPNFILIRGTTAKLWTQTCQNLGIFSNFRQKKSNIFVKNRDIENPKRSARSWGCLLSY